MIAFRFNPTMAEIVPGIAPTWHIVRCHPGHEGVAAAHLAGRRFGVYVPLEDFWVSSKAQGERVERQAPLFPGYVFVFVWGLAQHVQRVRACPGVSGFLVDHDGAPLQVDDAIIKQLQDIEWKQYLENLPRSFFRRKRRGEQFEIKRWSAPNHGFGDPNPANRIEALHKALGL